MKEFNAIEEKISAWSEYVVFSTKKGNTAKPSLEFSMTKFPA